MPPFLAKGGALEAGAFLAGAAALTAAFLAGAEVAFLAMVGVVFWGVGCWLPASEVCRGWRDWMTW